MRSVILSEENYYRLNTLKTFSPLGEKIEFCFQYSFSQNTSIIWKCKLVWDRQWTSWTQGFLFLLNLKGKKSERLKMKLLHQNSHLISIVSAAQLHQAQPTRFPAALLKDAIQEGVLAMCSAVNPGLIKRNMQLCVRKAFGDCEVLKKLFGWILFLIPWICSLPF